MASNPLGLPAHSPLGFSSAERYRHCAGSPALIASLPPSESPDPEYRVSGSAAHAAWAWCLREGKDAWEASQHAWEGYELTGDDIEAGQFYLDMVRSDEGEWEIELIEEFIHAPEIHELAYGTLDHARVSLARRCAKIRDYKHGEGVFVEAEGNWQAMGYAALLLSRYPTIEHFEIEIDQPRFAGAAKMRKWEISASQLAVWVHKELRPAMLAADPAKYRAGKPIIPNLSPGPWCQTYFCPAAEQCACPARRQEVATIEASPPDVKTCSDEELGRLYSMVKRVTSQVEAIKAETTRRRLAGIDVPYSKTVLKQAFRVWKAGAEAELVAAYGDDAYTKPTLIGPADVEKLPGGKEIIRQYAETPDNGYTVAPLSSRRKAVVIQKPSETFGKFLTAQGVSE